jgi:hypothetical protein
MLFKENLKRAKEAFLGAFNLKYDEQYKGHMKGEFHIVCRDARTGHVVEERRGHNIIVNTASILIARLLKDSREPDAGISYLAVGTGAVGWNLQNPPQPTVFQTALYSEIARKAFTTPDVNFIDPETGDPTVVPTGVVDFAMTFAETEAVGPLVEMGLFGGDASDLRDSGTEVNYRTFPVLNKTNSMVMTITFRITA